MVAIVLLISATAFSITGRDIDLARKGDGLRLWESHGSRVERNRVAGARDVVIWYSERVTVRDNVVTAGRYGLHFMYASGSRVTGNCFERNAAGAYAMYSADLVYERNVMAGNHGPSAMDAGKGPASRSRSTTVRWANRKRCQGSDCRT